MRFAPKLSPEVRAAIFHFTVFSTMGVSTVYFSIWLTEKGIDADQIGIINAVPVIAMLGVNMFIGRLADRASDWRTVILILALLGGIVPIGLFFVNEFWGIIAIWTLCMMTSGTIAPLIDAATVRLTQRNGTDFGAVRAWGTVGYTVASALTGVAIVWFGTAAFLPLFLGFALLRAAAGLQLPRFRAPRMKRRSAASSPALPCCAKC